MRVYVEDQQAAPANKTFLRKYPLTILLLAALTALAYGWAARTPSIFGDEWGLLSTYINLGAPAYPEGDVAVRPFGLSWISIVHRLVGANMVAYHAFAALISFVSAILLLLTLDIMLPDWAAYNGAVAALYLLFPADMTRMWLAGNVTYGAAVHLAAAVFFALFWRDGRWWAWAIGMILSAFALGAYESGMGVMLALSGLAFLFGRHRPRPERLGLLGPALVAIVYAVWRWQWQVAQVTAFGHSTSNLATSPISLGYRFLLGARYLLLTAWTDAGLTLLPFSSGNELITLAVGMLIVAALVGLALLAARQYSRRARRLDPATGRDDDAGMGRMSALVKAGAVGLVVLAAGYFPTILAVTPGAEYTASRAHSLPSIGAAMLIVAILFGVGWWLGRTPARARFIALAGLAPLLVLGLVAHLSVANETRQAWAEQKMIWHDLFQQAPDIAPGTHVLLLLEGYDDPGKGPRPIISGPWGVTSALNFFYGRDKLDGFFAVGGPSQVLSIEGDELLVNIYRTFRFPGEETLVFVFNRADQELVQLKELKNGDEVLSLGAERIIDASAAETEWRRLVAD